MLKRNQPPTLTLFNIVPWAQCCGEYSDILCHMHTVVWDTNPMGVQCMYTEDQFFGGMMHVHDIELYVGTCSYMSVSVYVHMCVCVYVDVCLCVCCVCAWRVCIWRVCILCVGMCVCACVCLYMCVCAFRVCLWCLCASMCICESVCMSAMYVCLL